MSDITFAGKRYPKTVIYTGAAAVVGIVGYAWWTKGAGESEDETTEDPLLVDTLGDERITPTTIDTYDVSVDNRVSPRNNAEWSNVAVDRLITEGYTASAVRSAIGNFLARRPLSKTDAGLVRAAISAAGMPPENGPWVIIEEPPPPVVTPPPAVSRTISFQPASADRTSIKFRWNKVTGATYYNVLPRRGQAAGGGQLALKAVAREEWNWYGLHPGYAYGVTVVAYNAAKKEIARGKQEVRTAR